MALIVEDGTVVVGAESYISEADSLTYHAARGNSPWPTITQAQREEALRRATDYMNQMYRSRWKGYRKTAVQTLDWPRTYVHLEPFTHGAVGAYPFLVADNIVPVEVKNACAEFAIRAAAGELTPDLTRAESSVRVGEISVTYDPTSSEAVRYRALDAMLAPYLTGSAMNLRVVRT